MGLKCHILRRVDRRPRLPSPPLTPGHQMPLPIYHLRRIDTRCLVIAILELLRFSGFAAASQLRYQALKFPIIGLHFSQALRINQFAGAVA